MVSLQAIVVAAALTAGGETVLLDFTADWCGPCRLMRPVVQQLRDAGYPIREIDVDRHPDLVRRYAAQEIPCFVLLVNGQEVRRLVGAVRPEQLTQLFQQAGGRPGPETAAAVRPPTVPTSLTALPRPSSPSRPGAAELAGTGPLPPLPPPASAHGDPALTADQQAVQQRALEATVRIKVEDEQGSSYGTGTIIDTHQGEALVLTCGHLFRDSQGQGQISIDMFVPGFRGPVPAQLVTYDAGKRDIGLVCFRPGISVTPVPVASPGSCARQGDPVFSIGCDHGDAPTIQVSSISAVDRYLGPPNLEIRGQPVVGRSGGGLFTADGRLTGVCNAADREEDRGVFAALATVHLVLKERQLDYIYLAQQTPEPLSPPPPAVAASEHRPDGAEFRGPAVRSLPAAGLGEDLEVICIVRSRRDPDRDSQVVVLEQPSEALVQQLLQQARPPMRDAMAAAELARATGPSPRSTTPGRNSRPTVRAQNR